MPDQAISILIVAIYFIVILILVVFKLIVSPTKIDEVMSCVMILNLTEGCPEMFDPVWYQFSTVTCEAFSGIVSIFPEIRTQIKKSSGLKSDFLADFGFYALVEWIKHLQSTTISFSGFGKNSNPLRFKGKLPAYKIPKEIKDTNIFLKNDIGSPFPINLPENITIEKEKGALVLDHKFFKITIKIIFNQWIRSIDSRTSLILDKDKDEKTDYATVSGVISFKTDFKIWSVFSNDSKNYEIYVSNLLENLRLNYSWSEYLNSLKEYAFWKHMLKDE